MELAGQLAKNATSATPPEWQPRLFDPKSDEHRHQINGLLTHRCWVQVHDTIEGQTHEVIKARRPSRTFTKDELDQEARNIWQADSPSEYGLWVYFPWLRCLVHTLPESEYHFLRSNRNCYKITPEEQNQLRSFTIGIVGLSVGKAAAQTLALEGIGGSFRLADCDTLSLSNLNRLQGGIQHIGLNKTILAARQMFEINPFLKIELQLGSAVTLGGAVITDTARRILLGHLQGSGRFYIDLETLVQRQCAVTLSKPVAETATATESYFPISPYPRPAGRNAKGVSTDEIRFIVFHGSLAPSGGNVQPWRFEWRKGQLDAIHLPDRSRTLLDFNSCASHVALAPLLRILI